MEYPGGDRSGEMPALASSADAIRRLSAHTLDAVVTMSADGRVTGWNAKAEALFGWCADEVLGEPMDLTIVPERYRAAHRAGLARYRRDGVGPILDTHVDIEALHRDGHELSIEMTITALVEADGVTFVAFVRDLTEQRHMAEALFDSEARFARVIENLPGVAYIDEVGMRGVFVSSKIEQILGYTPEEWLADSHLWESRLHPDDRERALATIAAGEASGGSFASVYRLRARDEREVWIHDRATVHVGASGEARIHGVMFDITRERGIEAEMELAAAERAAIAESLRRLPAGSSTADIASSICRELSHIDHLTVAVVYEFRHDGSVVPIGQRTPAGAPIIIDEPLPATRAAYLRESATGPWIDEWKPRARLDGYQRAWLDVGMTWSAYVPFGADGETYGVLEAGSIDPIGVSTVTRWLPGLTEFGAIAAALLGRELGDRRREAGARAEILAMASSRDLEPVFQPIVRLSDASVVGFEALTRFPDGTPPERRFAVADALGAGTELEMAAVAAAVDAAAALPAGAFLSVNLTPARLMDPSITDLLRRARRRRVVVEITERLPIDDYDIIRSTLKHLGKSVDIAVDDAGAGFASLRHILELSPRYVKLDMQLVRGIEADAARQALIAGMVYFARHSGCLLIAEGIETEAEHVALRRLGVPFGQGFLFGRSAPAARWAAAKVHVASTRRPQARAVT